MYGIGSWDGLCLTVLEHTCSLMQRKNLCCLSGETHKTFPARSYYFIRKVVYKITFAFEVYARGCQPKNDIRMLPRAPAKKPSSSVKDWLILHWTLISLSKRCPSYGRNTSSIEELPYLCLCSALMVLWSKKCLYHPSPVGTHGLPVCFCSILLQ